MSVEPLVSVKMLTYNHEPYIAQAIEGVINQQTNFPFELVIGEDCSTDNTRQIVLNYQKKYPDIIRLIISDENVGAHKNSIRLDNACRGKYLAFCEGDDYWHTQDKLQKQIDFLENNPTYGMVHCNVNTFNTSSGELIESYLRLTPDLNDANAYFEILTDTRHVFTLTVCVRKYLLFDVIQNNPECTDGRFLMGDFQRWLELSRVTKIKYFPESLATYNILVESASRSNDRNRVLRFEQSIKEACYYYLTKYDCPKDIAYQVQCSNTLRVLRAAIYANNLDVIKNEKKEISEFGLTESLNWRERLICWGCEGPLRNQLVQFFRKVWVIKKKFPIYLFRS